MLALVNKSSVLRYNFYYFRKKRVGELNHVSIKSGNRAFLAIMLFLQVMAYVVIFFDVPVARQVFGFIYLTFIPGFVVTRALKMDGLDTLETVLFSVGISIVLMMFFGFLINEFLFLLGVFEPLTFTPIMMFMSTFLTLGTILAFLRGNSNSLWKGNIYFHPSVFGLIILPVLSIVGSIYVTIYGNNVILLLMIVMIATWFIIGLVSNKLLPSKLYSIALILIALSLLFHSSFISNYIFPYGSDSPLEYYVFKITEVNKHWNSTNPFPLDLQCGRFYSMLSITILPTIYSILLKADPTWIFKVIYPILFSFVPLGLYQLWKKRVDEKNSFIATFFFMSFDVFFTEMIGLNRQMVAELFFVLLLLTILNERIKRANKMLCFMIFSFGLVTSHYGLSEIFLFFISIAFIYLCLVKKSSKSITPIIVSLFFVIMFAWYIFTSSSAVFDSILEFGNNIYNQLSDFFNPYSREPEVLRGLGLEEPPTIWHAISRVFAYATEFLIVVGFISLIIKKSASRFSKEYFILTFSAMMLLAAIIILPGLGGTMNTTRFYHILLFFLAPLSVIGAKFTVKLVKRHNELLTCALLLTILVPYFLFQTYFIYEIVGCRSSSVPLSGYRMHSLRLYGSFGYMDDYSVYGARWFSKNVQNSELYADDYSLTYVLTSYGMIYREGVNRLSNTTILANNDAVYLSTLSVIYNTLLFGRLSWNTSELYYIFDDLNIVYENGGSEICKYAP